MSTDVPKEESSGKKHYTETIKTVIKSEKDYLEKRRNEYKVKSLDISPDLWGLCISGGGIRSATLGLGMIQKFIRENIFKIFDYMSTVSGGGYIGSCLSSLMAGEKSDKIPPIDVEPENSPFVGLNKEEKEYKTAKDTKLSVRHQLHHLRTHGEYLIPRKKLLTRDFQRAIGVFLTGMFHQLIMFILLLICLVAFFHGLLAILTDDSFLKELNYFESNGYQVSSVALCNLAASGMPDSVRSKLTCLNDQVFFKGKDDFLARIDDKIGVENRKKYESQILIYAVYEEDSFHSYILNEVKIWAYVRIFDPVRDMFINSKKFWIEHLISSILGFICGSAFILLVQICGNKIRKIKNAPPLRTRSGFDVEDYYESIYIRLFNWLSIILAIIIMVILATWRPFHPQPLKKSLAVILLPLSFAIGGRIAAIIFIHLRESLLPKQDRIRRSLFSSLHGATFYGLALAILAPIILVFLFSLDYFSLRFWWALIALVLSYLLFNKKVIPGIKVGKIISRFFKPLLTILVLIFIALSFNWASAALLPESIDQYTINGFSLFTFSCIVLGASFLVFIALGFLVNANRISPHYFYRDRLVEAYMKTSARFIREEKDECKYQGKPLVILRNDEDLYLKNIGNKDNRAPFRAPYHLVNCAINLQGTTELNRKTMLSEPFLFSANYVGSEVTGYVRTKDYRGGFTKLARAITISAAAAGSAMGFYSFWALAFSATLFNLRLGYWMANPWYYCNKIKNPERKVEFWPTYLLKEFFNKSNARSRLVNLSDGGHTGDNLGLYPLLQRRCKHIVICDFEADDDYDFESFNHAVRMAYIEKNIRIHIDLSEIVPAKNEDGSSQFSKKSVAKGKIIYSEEEGDEGTIYYLKSSLSEMEMLTKNEEENLMRKLPVHVKNYHKDHSKFPHQTTADQFFDDAQFEAYRALGEYIATQALDSYQLKEVVNGYLKG